jgi:hypothetical protein
MCERERERESSMKGMEKRKTKNFEGKTFFEFRCHGSTYKYCHFVRLKF